MSRAVLGVLRRDEAHGFVYIDAFTYRRPRGRRGRKVIATSGLAGDHAPAIQIDRRPKRRRAPSLAAKVKAARKAGATAIMILPDGTVSATFVSEQAKPQGNALDEWMANRANKPKGH